MESRRVNSSGTERYHCPVCGKDTAPGRSSFPFCCKRCRLLDLGLWKDESYRISREIKPLDEDSYDVGGGGAFNELK